MDCKFWVFTDDGKNFLCTYLIHIFVITSMFSVYALTNDFHKHVICRVIYFVDLLVISGFLSYKFPLFKFGEGIVKAHSNRTFLL
jgi:hypothetical protein